MTDRARAEARTGGGALVDALLAHGARMVFGVPGESFLAALDALHDVADRLPFITCRHEAAAANMAEAFGKLTGAPGIAFVTRGPGATHATIGLHTAFQDSTPMVLLIGQVARAMIGREAFQEIDYRRFLSEVTKWTGEVGEPARIAEHVGRAFHTAMAGRRGPVALSLPEDVLEAPAPVPAAASRLAVMTSAAAEDVVATARALSAARKPLILVGGGPWTTASAATLRAFAERHHLPVAAAFRCQSLLDNRSPAWAGHLGIGADPKLVAHVRSSDCLLVIGARLGEMTTAGYSRLDPARPQPQMIHVHAGAEELGRVWQAGRQVHAAPAAFVESLAAEGIAGDHEAWCAGVHGDARAWSEPVGNPGDVQLAGMYRQLRAALPDEAVVANGAGNYAAWLHRFFEYRDFRTQLAPTSGAMGYGVPAGIAAALVHPDRPAVAVAGDGCFLMSGNELATAVRHGARTIFLVLDNGMLGTIRMHQEREHPGRVIGTDLANPDFVAYAKSFGIPAFRVEHGDDFVPAFKAARASEGPALLHIRVDRRALSPTMALP